VDHSVSPQIIQLRASPHVPRSCYHITSFRAPRVAGIRPTALSPPADARSIPASVAPNLPSWTRNTEIHWKCIPVTSTCVAPPRPVGIVPTPRSSALRFHPINRMAVSTVPYISSIVCRARSAPGGEEESSLYFHAKYPNTLARPQDNAHQEIRGGKVWSIPAASIGRSGWPTTMSWR